MNMNMNINIYINIQRPPLICAITTNSQWIWAHTNFTCSWRFWLLNDLSLTCAYTIWLVFASLTLAVVTGCFLTTMFANLLKRNIGFFLPAIFWEEKLKLIALKSLTVFTTFKRNCPPKQRKIIWTTKLSELNENREQIQCSGKRASDFVHNISAENIIGCDLCVLFVHKCKSCGLNFRAYEFEVIGRIKCSTMLMIRISLSKLTTNMVVSNCV